METTISTGGVKLRKVLEEAGMSQKELVKLTGLEQSVVSRITSARFNATPQEKLKIALALKRPVKEIFPD